MAHHSSVNYVEPNLISNGSDGLPWKVYDWYERAPRLEDYCITLNLEVEVCSRDNISQDSKKESEVLIMQYKTNIDNGSASTVSFFGGTRINTGNDLYESPRYLTTHYADMYVGDLIDYGTTELIGIKSVDIQYEKSCVPRISIKFVDVRGMSLFQPTELSRTKEYQGIKGLNRDNVAQSFFQCFFRVPMPRFTITIKGFYGKPVTYELMCDKFTTNFNSQSGDFEIDTSFIGYSYSFLTDVSLDALLAAPFSDFDGGRNYWLEKTQDLSDNGFTIWNKERTVKKPMPTLFEIWQEMKDFLKKPVDISTELSEEEKDHSSEISQLTTIRDKFRAWYESLYDVCVRRYGKDYCYLFKENRKEEAEYYRLLVLTTNKIKNTTMFDEYKGFPDVFKAETQSLYSAIETFNSDEKSFKKLENVSLDFSDYEKHHIFNNLFVNAKGEVCFNDFSRRCDLSDRTSIINNVFYGVSYSGETEEAIKSKQEQHKKHVLETMYGDGVDQYVWAYVVDIDYRPIRDRIVVLQSDANQNSEAKLRKKKIKAINKKMYDNMSWYPSVENFTRIVMAHLECLMRQMYNVVNKCENRTADQLGITVGPNGNANDVSESGYKDKNGDIKDIIPPFPRVGRQTVNEDNITNFEDVWIEDFNDGIEAFAEADFINGLFNAAERIQALFKDTNAASSEGSKEISQPSETPIIKRPLSSFDFFLTKSPYGDSSEISNDLKGYQLAGKIAMRMYQILGMNNLKNDLGDSFFTNGDYLKNMGHAEADNFYDLVSITNPNLITMIRDGVITASKVLEIVSTSGNTDAPWGESSLFINSEDKFRPRTISNYGLNLLPLQDYSFSDYKEWKNALNGEKIVNFDGSAYYDKFPNSTDNKTLFKGLGGFGNLAIYEYPTIVDNMIDSASSYGDSGYTPVCGYISGACISNVVSEGDNNIYDSFFKVQGKCSIATKQDKGGVAKGFKLNGVYAQPLMIETDEEGNEKENYASEYTSQDISGVFKDRNSVTITEIFGFKDGNSGSTLDYDKALLGHIEEECKGGNKTENNGCSISQQGLRLTKILMGIKLNWLLLGNYLKEHRTVNYIPNVAALQIGAIIFANQGTKESHGWKYEESHLPTENIYAGLINYIQCLKPGSRQAYMRYYLNWVKKNEGVYTVLGTDEKYYLTFTPEGEETTNRRILNEQIEKVKDFTNELLRPLCIVHLARWHSTRLKSNEAYIELKHYSLKKSNAQKFLNAFFERLEQLYGINYTQDEHGNLVRTVDEPKKTSDDMKIELYRYMKQLYDKWVPMSPFEHWTLPSFFPKDDEDIGHKFYFIDSYYNKINHKLVLNPRLISEKIEAMLTYNDVNSMMLGFLADIFSANKCMLMSIQNFADLSSPNSMDEMFTPIPYNDIDWGNLNKYPSFVVVYPYQPSRNLDIPDNEYNNDGFMLNDEFDTPLAIRSKDNNQYRIPAFGVSYGKQYQSYFKSVNINTQNPVVTEQSIKAKHYIIREQASTKEKGIVAQDMFEVYSSYSYMAEIEMMGCAWVQPLMYFVLLNVPMFNGSYMIMKVSHSITPGNMTTKFTGCRMAKVSNKIVEDIFTDEDYDEDSVYSGGGNENPQTSYVDIDNDCPYKVYPLISDFESTDIVEHIKHFEGGYIGKNKGDNVECTMQGVTIGSYRKIVNQNATCNDLHNISDDDWNLVFNTICDEIRVSEIKDKSVRGMIIDFKWMSGGAVYVVQRAVNAYYQAKRIDNSITVDGIFGDGTINAINGMEDQETFFDILKQKRLEYLRSLSNYKVNSEGWEKRVDALKYTKEREKPESGTTSDEPNYHELLFEALNRTCQNTPSINTKIKIYEEKIGDNMKKHLGNDNEFTYIVQEDGKRDKLHLVFDALLNSEYYQYVSEVVWLYENGGLESDAQPKMILYMASKSPTSHKICCMLKGDAAHNRFKREIPKDCKNTNLLKSLAKKKANLGGDAELFKSECPQLSDTSILDEYTPKSCGSLFGGGGPEEHFNSQNASEIKSGVVGNIDGWDVGKACSYIQTKAYPQYIKDKCGHCASAVEDAIAAGGGPLSERMYCGGDGKATNLRYHGIIEKKGFVEIASGTVNKNPSIDLQAGDVAIIGPVPESGGKYHACMYANGWYSDFKQNNMNVYPTSQPYAIYRFRNKKMV